MKPQVFVQNPLCDIFPDTLPCGGRTYALHMAKNEGEGFIIGVRSGSTPLTKLSAQVVCDAPKIEWAAWHIGYVPFSRNSIHIGVRSVRARAPGVLPEYFRKEKEIDLPAEQSTGIYISAYTVADTPAGEYTGYVLLTADGFEEKVNFTLKVYDVTMPEPDQSRFTYVCWTRLLSAVTVKNVYGLDMWTDEYWEYVKRCAVIMRRERQNSIDIELDAILLDNVTDDGNGNLVFDFTNFDKFAEIMLDKRYLGAKQLCGMHLLYRDGSFDPLPRGWAQRPMNAWIVEKQADGTFKKVWKPASHPDAEAFHRQLFAALAKHLREKGWNKLWAQHVADEIDNDIHYQQTKAVYELFHEYLPEARTIDAVRRETPYTFGKELDIHVPLLWQYDMSPAAYAEIQDERTEVWHYTCLQPQFEYLGRIGDYPLIATRLICWYNFKQHLTGFLHYAWNSYSSCTVRWDPYQDVCCCGPLPCDAFIVYPDKENYTVLESVRSEAQRDTLEDYELLCLAAEKEPDTVRRLVNTAVTTADNYIRNTEFLMELRIRLLEIAEQ